MGDNIGTGTRAWWLEAELWERQGMVESVLRLLEQECISRAKALELIRDAVRYRSRVVPMTDVPVASWNELNWCDDNEKAACIKGIKVPSCIDLEFVAKGIEIALIAVSQMHNNTQQENACRTVVEFLRKLTRTNLV